MLHPDEQFIELPQVESPHDSDYDAQILVRRQANGDIEISDDENDMVFSPGEWSDILSAAESGLLDID